MKLTSLVLLSLLTTDLLAQQPAGSSASKPTASPAPSPNSIEADPLIGRWKWDSNSITVFQPDGKATNSAPGKPTRHGTWERKGGEYEINWNNGLDVYRLIIRAGNELWKKNKGQWHHYAKRL